MTDSLLFLTSHHTSLHTVLISSITPPRALVLVFFVVSLALGKCTRSQGKLKDRRIERSENMSESVYKHYCKGKGMIFQMFFSTGHINIFIF